MTRRTAAVATSVALAALLAWPFAAEAQNRRRPRCNDLRALARFLQLNEQQAQQTRAIFEAFRDAAEPLREQVPPLRESLSSLLDADNPAAAAVGEIVIDIDSLHDQIEEAREVADAEFEALLTGEQRDRWQQFQDVCRPGYEHQR